MNKRQRRFKIIIDILRQNSVGSQEELMEMLKAKKVCVTQATLSRDLKTLRTSKVPTEFGGYRYVVAGMQAQNDYKAPLPNDATRHSAVLSVSRTGNIIVIKTRPGYAAALAYDIDEMQERLILGTIAGVNTVFVAVDETANPRQLHTILSRVIPATAFEKDENKI